MDINYHNKNGENALALAAFELHVDTCRFLLEQGVILDFPIQKRSGYETTDIKNIMFWRCYYDETNAQLQRTHYLLAQAKKLFEYIGIDDFILAIKYLTMAEGPNPPIALNARRAKDGNTALHVVLLRGHYNLAALLLENGASLDIINNAGVTARELGLMRMLTFGSDKAEEIPAKVEINKLLSFFINKDNINQPNIRMDGKTPLMYALSQGNFVAAKYLLDQPNINLSIQDNEGHDAFYYFSHSKDVKRIREVLFRQNDKRTKDEIRNDFLEDLRRKEDAKKKTEEKTERKIGKDIGKNKDRIEKDLLKQAKKLTSEYLSKSKVPVASAAEIEVFKIMNQKMVEADIKSIIDDAKLAPEDSPLAAVHRLVNTPSVTKPTQRGILVYIENQIANAQKRAKAKENIDIDEGEIKAWQELLKHPTVVAWKNSMTMQNVQNKFSDLEEKKKVEEQQPQHGVELDFSKKSKVELEPKTLKTSEPVKPGTSPTKRSPNA